MSFRFFFTALIFSLAAPIYAAIIGTNAPAAPLTMKRIAALPADRQLAWKNYLERSARQMKADRAFLRAEMKAHGVESIIIPPPSHATRGIALDESPDWYRGAKAQHIAGVILSFQTPAGGWSKNLDMTGPERAPGENFAADNTPQNQKNSDNDAPADRNWNYVGTFDNNATTTQLRFLAKVIAATNADNAVFKKSFGRGLDYIFAAQFPNGGWPQVWPLQGGYHDAITFNDNAMLNVMELLRDVVAGANEFSFVPEKIRARAAASFKRGIDCILATQIIANGRRTVWCQQHDALTLQPTSARNYEMPAAASSESAVIVLFLMQLPNPNSNVVATVRAACAWFEKTKIEGKAYRFIKGRGRQLVDAPGSTIWARYYEIGSDRPLFGDRDKSIHDDVNEISLERRNGYGWFGEAPQLALEHFMRWDKSHPHQTGGGGGN